jgi:GNAT superfamily N-acetyltransferase
VPLTVRRASDDDAAAIAEVWLRAFASAYAFPHAHTDDDVRRWIRDEVVSGKETWVGQDDRGVVGFIALAPGWVEHLYIDPVAQGEGIGRRLLELAMTRDTTGELQLWTFQANDRARRFYARNGFVEVEMTEGTSNEERQPDVRLVWRRPAGPD